MNRWLFFILASNFLSPPAAGATTYRLENAFPNLTFKRPVWMCHKPDNSSQLLVVEQAGVIRTFDNSPRAKTSRIFLDIRDRVSDRNNEEGLLGLAFDPLYSTNGHFFVFYSAARPRRMVVSRFQSIGGVAKKSSELILLEVKQPYGNHNGGTLLFGPDAKLYIGLGDGGSGGDPQNHGQNLQTLLGTILRIDVRNASFKERYTVPSSNPFVGVAGARPEIWAYGLRNPWRMSFDRETGELWAGDVGQNAYEEINLIIKGGNYGWRHREGTHPYRKGKSSPSFIGPIAEYGHDQGQCIVGGYVYRGKRLPQLEGAYLFADYVSGLIGAVHRRNGKADTQILLRQPNNISSLAEGPSGELFFLAFDGNIYQLVH